MKVKFKSLVAIYAVAAVISPVVMSAGSAWAQPQERGTNANYVAAGVAAGVTNGGSATNDDDAELGVAIQGRLTTSKAPISLRGSVQAGDDTSAIIPMLTVDVPIAKNVNAYVGAGASLVEENGVNTPLGNRDSFAGVVGAEAQVGRNFVGFTDVKVGLNAYEDSSAEAVSVNAGVGLKF
ncbi:MAG: hypothetical protein F6K58_17010 [Symploca sp. SIO2E9]|nr:hypothetical protein [Symploca sp. SIO2E9]